MIKETTEYSQEGTVVGEQLVFAIAYNMQMLKQWWQVPRKNYSV